jgi:hypothetical protein
MALRHEALIKDDLNPAQTGLRSDLSSLSEAVLEFRRLKFILPFPCKIESAFSPGSGASGLVHDISGISSDLFGAEHLEGPSHVL